VLAYRWLWGFAVLVFLGDQLSKCWITGRLPLHSYGSSGLTVFPGFFNLVHVGNTGAAWSMFSGRSTMLALLALGTLTAIFFWRKHLGLNLSVPQFCFGLLCGGTVGNLLDRVRHGYVTDFLDFHFGDYIFPTFNLADSAICIGVFSYILWSMKQPEGGNLKPQNPNSN
jgi:signal peptidase II